MCGVWALHAVASMFFFAALSNPTSFFHLIINVFTLVIIKINNEILVSQQIAMNYITNE